MLIISLLLAFFIYFIILGLSLIFYIVVKYRGYRENRWLSGLFYLIFYTIIFFFIIHFTLYLLNWI